MSFNRATFIFGGQTNFRARRTIFVLVPLEIKVKKKHVSPARDYFTLPGFRRRSARAQQVDAADVGLFLKEQRHPS